jgi:hypothetical protein
MKKIQLFVLALCFVFASQLFAGGVNGYVRNSKGQGKPGVRVTIKYGNQTNYTHTDRYGYYQIDVPVVYAGVRGKVYAQGIYVARCTVPKKGYNVVNVRIK